MSAGLPDEGTEAVMNATDYNRGVAIETIFRFVGDQPADPQGFRAWLESLNDQQLQNYYDKVVEL